MNILQSVVAVAVNERSRDQSFPRPTIPNLLRLATESLSTIATTAASHSHAVSSALKRVGHNEA
jgi:hypothetical protein